MVKNIKWGMFLVINLRAEVPIVEEKVVNIIIDNEDATRGEKYIGLAIVVIASCAVIYGAYNATTNTLNINDPNAFIPSINLNTENNEKEQPTHDDNTAFEDILKDRDKGQNENSQNT